MDNATLQVCHMSIPLPHLKTTVQGDEVETLGAIYGEDFRHQPQNPRVYSVSVATPDESHRLWIQVTITQSHSPF